MNLPVPVLTIGLLLCSNLFMTFAWYGHLRFKAMSLPLAIVISWGIAFLEYCLMIPANRIGYGYFNAAELKGIQEIVSLSIFAVFSWCYLHESLRWNQVLAFVLISVAAVLLFKK